MAYSDFTLKRVKSELKLEIIETLGLFATIEPIPISDALHRSLKRNLLCVAEMYAADLYNA